MIKKYLKEGFSLKSKGYFKHAIEAFYKAMEIDNSSSELLLEIADVYYLMGEEEHALNYIEQVIEKNPTHIGSLQLLKKIFIDKKAFTEAEQTAKNLYFISGNPKDLSAILELLNKQKRFEDVLNYKIDSQTPDILFELAYAKLFLGELENAEAIINNALQEVSDSAKFNILKAKILFKQNRTEEVVEILSSIKIKEPNADYLNFIGLVKQSQNEYKVALQYFLEAIKTNSNIAEYYYNCASTYFKMDDIKLAKKYYNLAISLEPDNSIYHFALANLYYSQQQYKRALEELNSNLFEAQLLKAIILFDTGFFAIAQKEFEQLSLQAPENEVIKTYKDKIKSILKTN